MIYEPQKHQRRSVQLANYNYAEPGAYFVTIIVHKRRCIFGEVVDGKIELNGLGQIVTDEWERSHHIR